MEIASTQHLDFDWSNTVFCDEKTFKSSQHGRLQLWRRDGTRHTQDHVIPNKKSGRIAHRGAPRRAHEQKQVVTRAASSAHVSVIVFKEGSSFSFTLNSIFSAQTKLIYVILLFDFAHDRMVKWLENLITKLEVPDPILGRGRRSQIRSSLSKSRSGVVVEEIHVARWARKLMR
ncbi:hypothetical protein MSG28_000682 [Choristoneura fumiferana]|uniref:Uncharacterized protein n=1 Tax=Choristoneura fumiferana TaxID=7141 RepID=A0ACC0K210_CHOFU|nr:hypothetical protein MSG28_000682 [Choristoneura fumiferana]